MKRVIFLFINTLSMLNVFAQTLSVSLHSHTPYYYEQDKYLVKELSITNISSDTLIIWIVDSLKKENELQNIKNYFFKNVGDMSLSSLIYDGNVSEVSIDVGCSFIKELPPANTFTIFFIDTCIKHDDYYSRFADNRIVFVKKNSLRTFHFCDNPIWHRILYNDNTIILPNL